MDPISLRVAARYKGKKTLPTGTVVYEYSEHQVSRRNNEKARRLEALRKSVHKLRAQVKKDLQSEDPDKVLTALAVGLMDHTAERVGNDESAEEGHVGVTGWQKSHISFGKGKATIKYVGKSGVKQQKVVSDKGLVSALKDAYEACEDDSIFCHDTGRVDAKKVNAYLKKFDITAKDLRGLHANTVMQQKLKTLRKRELPTNAKERKELLKKEFKQALEETAKAVGHEPSTLRSQYLVPNLEEEYMKGRVMTKMVKTAYDSIAERVANRHLEASEVLTKEWLMGVRRGWLQLMKPSITDYESVLKAHDALSQFVENLRDQIKYVRRGVYTRLEGGKYWAKLNEQFETLLKALRDSKSKAEHWKSYLDGAALSLQWGEDRSEDARKMLDLYKRDFAEASNTTVKLRGQRWKAVDLTHLMDQILKILREDAKRLTEWGLQKPLESFYKEFDLNGMKVVVDDRTVSPSEIKEYIKYLDAAYQRLQQKGFGKVWYGTVFIKCKTCGGANMYGPELGVGGDYPIGRDVVNVYSRPSKFIVELMAHELGHRYWFKTMNQAQRAKFKDLISIELPEPNYTPRQVDPAKIQTAKALVDKVYEPVQKLLKDFGSSRLKWRASIKKYEDSLGREAYPTSQALITAVQSISAWVDDPEIKSLYNDVLQAGQSIAHSLTHMEEDLNNEVNSVSEPMTAPADLDAYWKSVFDPIQKKWIDAMNLQIDTAVAAAYLYIDTAVQAYNKKEQETAEKLDREWEEKAKEMAKKVPPVSNYGSKHIDEAFAEVFAHYIVGKDMSQDQIETFKEVLKTATVESVVARYLQKSAAVQPVNEQFVEQLRKDVLLLLKNIPRIKDEATHEQLRLALVAWRKHFYAVIYDRWLNNLPLDMDPQFKKFLDGDVRRLSWDLYSEMGNFHSIGWWNARDLKLWGKRVQRKASAFWKELRYAIKTYNGYYKARSKDYDLETEIETKEVHTLTGFKVVVKAFDTRDDLHWAMLKRLEDALRLYRQRATQVMPLLLKMQRPMIFDFNAHLDKGGQYFRYDRGLIMINPAGMIGQVDNKRAVKTMAHEMGHHLYNVFISGEARQHWDSAIYGDYGDLDLNEVLKLWPEHSDMWIHDFIDYLAPKDSILALQVAALLQEYPRLGTRDELVELRDKKPVVRVPKTPITGYAFKNPEEAFCETIGLLVAYGTRAIHPRIRQLIQTILPGQIKLAQLVADRYLSAL